MIDFLGLRFRQTEWFLPAAKPRRSIRGETSPPPPLQQESKKGKRVHFWGKGAHIWGKGDQGHPNIISADHQVVPPSGFLAYLSHKWQNVTFLENKLAFIYSMPQVYGDFLLWFFKAMWCVSKGRTLAVTSLTQQAAFSAISLD